MPDYNEQNEQKIELLEPVTDEKPIINKTKLLISNLKDSRKNKKYIIGFLGILVLVIGVVLFISMQKKFNIGGPQVNEDGTIAIETGTKWGDTYATFIQKQLEGFETYDVALVDLNFDKTPEMLVKYTDNYKKDTLKIFYITEDEVFSSKNYYLYSLHLLYSLQDREVGWYIHITTTGDYGAYTSLDKIISGKTLDSDIKTTNATLLEEFKRTYVDADYDIVFYQINSSSFVDDIKTVISRYETYEKNINMTVDKLKKDNSDKEYSNEKVETDYSEVEYLIFNGKKVKFGTYMFTDSVDNVAYLSINRDGTVTIGESIFKFDVNYNGITLENDSLIVAADNGVLYEEKKYIYYMDEVGNVLIETEEVLEEGEEDTN